MGLLEGKKALILGLANDHSIAWGIAQALHAEGAELGFNFFGETLERRVRPLATSLNAKLIEPCNVANDEDITALFARVAEQMGALDIVIHAVAFARREELADGFRFVNTSRDGWATAMDISAYSLIAVTRAALPVLNPGASILTLSYYGAEKVVQNYNVMGVAKAALEMTVRYLAADIGPQGFRVNAISAGPIRTLSAAGIGSFRSMHRAFAEAAPLRRNVTTEDVGNTAAWLCSDRASAITGEVVYVDAGYNIMGMSEGPKEQS